jgi:poly(3-hydroxyalkanoate) synthetase
MLQTAVNAELTRRNTNLLNGIHCYLNHPYRRRESIADVVWQQGHCRLLDFGVEGPEKTQMLFIPSLINRYYVLDLKDGRSMVEYLRRQGIRPLVMDWGEPDAEEQGFSCGDYVMKRLLPALATRHSPTPLFVAGYCMGGLLALALAQSAQSAISGLALIATPWDFHSPDFPHVALDSPHIQRLCQLIEKGDTVSGDVIQTLFYATNPWLFARKFAAFSKLDPTTDDAEEFVAIESWVNDTVHMSAPVARECLIDWVQHNQPACAKWKVDGKTIAPEVLDMPIFAACPAHDTIVPPNCAEPLLPLLHNRTVIRPTSGHVGMVAGANAEAELWHPLSAWVHAQI